MAGEVVRSKEEIISDLYALRGGLSVISGYTDKIRSCDLEIEQKQQELKKINRNCSSIQENLKFEQREIIKFENSKRLHDERIKNERNFAKNNAAEWAEGAKKSFLKEKLKTNIFGGITISFTIACIILIVLGLALKSSECFAAGAVLVEFIIVFAIIFIRCSRNLKSSKAYLEMKNIELERANALCMSEPDCPFSEEYYEFKEAMKNNQIRLSAERKQAEICTKLIEENEKEQKRILPTISLDCQNIKRALNATYDNWLSESDWQNVDLLIYYLETGRADTLKEALSMVDRQLQTNQIVDAISIASTAICDKIDTSMKNLSRALTASFNVISKQLSGISGKMDRVIDISERNAESYRELQKQNMQVVGELGEQIKELQSAQLTATDMNRALLEKANRSSEQLMNDLRYGQKFWIK